MGDLRRWSPHSHEEMRALAADFVATGGVEPSLREPGWSFSALQTSKTITVADELAEQVRDDLLPTAVQALAALAEELAVTAPVNPADAHELLYLAADITALHEAGVGSALLPGVTDEVLSDQVLALGNRQEPEDSPRKLGLFERRKLIKSTVAAYLAPDAGQLRSVLLRV